jgi:hypothetical protein
MALEIHVVIEGKTIVTILFIFIYFFLYYIVNRYVLI